MFAMCFRLQVAVDFFWREKSCQSCLLCWLFTDDQIMLGSPSFHGYRDANGGTGKSSL